jgi:hypothetical protein
MDFIWAISSLIFSSLHISAVLMKFLEIFGSLLRIFSPLPQVSINSQNLEGPIDSVRTSFNIANFSSLDSTASPFGHILHVSLEHTVD